MQTVSYVGNGKTTEFHFNFLFYENTNIVVLKNNQPATNYHIVGNSGGADADVPFIGGCVVFEHAPTTVDSITISRNLPLSRIADYQPTEKLDPTTLNQDLNYMMEIMKDFQDAFSILRVKYADITNNETAQILLQKMTAMNQSIENLGDVASIRDDITTLQNRTNNMLDYVVASQSPTAQNEYKWYRKYKSGWVEQGGRNSGNYEIGTNTLIIPMADISYSIITSRLCPTIADDNAAISLQVRNLSRTSFQVRQVYVAPGGGGGTGHGSGYSYNWIATGIAA